MYEKTAKIDNQTSDIIEQYSIEMKISKKEVLSRMANYCFFNNIDFSVSKSSLTLNKKLSEIENKIILKVSELPSIIKKIIDPDDYYFPIEDDYKKIILLNKKFIESNNLNEMFINSLTESERKIYMESLKSIEDFEINNL